MSVLLMRLAGPMQSWGVQSRFSQRETGLEPSKSGVVGLLSAALGFPREAKSIKCNDLSITLAMLAALKMAVRVDREGRLCRDYHTAQKVMASEVIVCRRSTKAATVVSQRFYLADADFLVGLEGSDRALLDALDTRLRSPEWPLFLGRKAFVPGCPVAVGVFDGELLAVLKSRAWLRRHRFDHPSKERDGVGAKLRLVIETPFGQGAEVRQDVPLGFDAASRQFGHCTIRHVTTEYHEPAAVEDDPCLCS